MDALHGESQTVLKPLGRMLRNLPGIAGSAILGNGRVALMLDVSGSMCSPCTKRDDMKAHDVTLE